MNGSSVDGGARDAKPAHLEESNSTEKVVPRRQRLRNHCARFWPWYLIGVIVFLAIFLPLLFTKIIPAIAQDLVDKADLPITGGLIAAASNDQATVGIQATLGIPSGIQARIDPIELYLYNEDAPEFSPYLTIPLPEQHVNGRTEVNINNETLAIGNKPELIKWLGKTLNQETVALSVRGNSTVYLGAIKGPIRLEKTVETPGLNNLKGAGIETVRIILPPEEDGSNLVGTVNFPNHSKFALGLGNLTLNVWAGDILAGQVRLFNILAPPGNTSIPFRGEIYLDTLGSNLMPILQSQSGALMNGTLGLVLSGNETSINGERVDYLEEVLNKARVYTEVPIAQLLADVAQSVFDGSTSFDGLAGLLGGGGDSGPFRDIFQDLLDNLTNLTNTDSTDPAAQDLRTAVKRIIYQDAAESAAEGLRSAAKRLVANRDKYFKST